MRIMLVRVKRTLDTLITCILHPFPEPSLIRYCRHLWKAGGRRPSVCSFMTESMVQINVFHCIFYSNKTDVYTCKQNCCKKTKQPNRHIYRHIYIMCSRSIHTTKKVFEPSLFVYCSHLWNVGGGRPPSLAHEALLLGRRPDRHWSMLGW